MSSPWRFLQSGAQSGAVNMALDERAALHLRDRGGLPALRLFRWHPWAISLGHHQKQSEIAYEQCLRDGIDLVRRPTGGRAILHAEELTYSIVMLAGGRGVLEIYHEISRALVRGLKLFGVEATLQRSQPDFRASYRQLSSIPCFSSAARYEIEWRGRKFVGSAQRRYGEGERDVVLQHGSILTGPAHRRLAEYLATEDRALLEKVRGDLERKTTDLSEILGAPVDLDRLASSIRSGFELEWGLTFVGEDHPPASVPSHQEAP